jgi:hypothetical protein
MADFLDEKMFIADSGMEINYPISLFYYGEEPE